MNSKQTLAVFGTAALCGLALAQTPKPTPPADRLDTLEKEVKELRGRFEAAAGAANDRCALLEKELNDTRDLVGRLVTWAGGQADGAAALATVLDDSEAKGFTYGINPDSRIVLLGGWRSFLTGMQKDVPKPVVAVDPKAPAPATKNPVRSER